MQVEFLLQRHGEKKGDALTPRGFRQVKRSAEVYLAGHRIDLAIFSGTVRTWQTIMHALATLGQSPPIMLWPSLWPEEEESPDSPAYEEGLKRALAGADPSVNPTIGAWLESWQPAWKRRGLIRGVLESVSMLVRANLNMHTNSAGGAIKVYGAGHSPSLEMLCSLAEQSLYPADIAHYKGEMDNGWQPFMDDRFMSSSAFQCPVRIVSARILRCPPVD